MEENEYVAKITTYCVTEFPCMVLFFVKEELDDAVKFDDVQDACEWLCKCGYHKTDRCWRRGEDFQAIIGYSLD